MYIFRKKYAVILLHIITQNFVSANLDHLTREQRAFAKIFTTFFNTPWINLNSSTWADRVTPDCGNDVTTLFRSAESGEMWALQMLDAASKIPSGILTGNIVNLGMYDECIGVKSHQNPAEIQGQYCLVSLSMPSKFVEDASRVLFVQKLSFDNPSSGVDLSLTSSVCLPSSCGVEDITGLVSASVQSMSQLAEFEVKVARVMCPRIGSAEGFTLESILAILFLAAVAIFLLFCTTCDLVARAGLNDASPALKSFAKFSLYSNAIELLSTKITPGSMPAINGIRFLSTFLCIIGHRGLNTYIKPKVNQSDIYEALQSWAAVFGFTILYTIDTFFLISGFLTTYWFLKRLRSGEKINLPMFYLHRYLRLTPCLAVLILFSIFILPYLGSGPIWDMIFGVSDQFCRNNWWTNLIYVQNFVNRYEMCMLHTWYLAAIMQLFWLSPIIFYPLHHRPKLGLVILGVLLIAALITPAVQLVVNQYSAFFNIKKNFSDSFEFVETYVSTYNRATPYLVGILLGYDVVNTKRRVTKFQAAFNWTLTWVVLLLCVWIVRFIQPIALVYNAFWEAAYVSVARFGWSISMAWIIYACIQGYGGPVTTLLSQPIFVPLSRMSYSIYLAHFVIQVGTSATTRVAEFYSLFGTVYLIWSDLAMSIVAAVIMILCFETPVLVLEKMLRNKKSSAII